MTVPAGDRTDIRRNRHLHDASADEFERTGDVTSDDLRVMDAEVTSEDEDRRRPPKDDARLSVHPVDDRRQLFHAGGERLGRGQIDIDGDMRVDGLKR